MKYYSQFNQDAFIHQNYFKNIKDGYFVDIGAHDGITFNNSKFFENFGWNGVCIEPNPKVFPMLQKNRRCECIQKAVSNVSGVLDFFQITEGPDMLSGLVNEFTKDAIERINLDLKEYPNSYNYIKVDCDLFENIIIEKNIDYLSIDTEGNELKILKTIDFAKYNIKVITVENNIYDNRFIYFLNKIGYEFIGRLGCDEVYKKIL